MTRFRSIRSSAAVGVASLTLAVATAAIPAAALGASSSDAGTTAATTSSVKATAGLGTYRVTITNLTAGQPLSPPLVVTNFGRGQIFRPGREANWGVQQIAENGDNTPLYESFLQDRKDGFVTDVQRSATPLLPPKTPGGGMFPQSVTLTIKAKPRDGISLISMIGCSNDGFVGFDAARLPATVGRSTRPRVFDYDAGTEENTEDFADLGAACQGAIGVTSKFGATGTSQTDWQLAEGGVVHRHEGIHEVSDDGLLEAVHGWKSNRTAKVVVTRIT